MQTERITPREFECPSCHAEPGEYCRVSVPYAGFMHEVRHRLADAANWKALGQELNLSAGWTLGTRS